MEEKIKKPKPFLSIKKILQDEKVMVLNARKKYGDNYANAEDFILAFISCVEITELDSFYSHIFYNSTRKHLLLALFSLTRLHISEYMMNLRHAIEDFMSMLYATSHTKEENDTFFEKDKDGNYKHLGRMYPFIEKNFKECSDFLKKNKGNLANTGAHSHAPLACMNSKERPSQFSFFDNLEGNTLVIGLFYILCSTVFVFLTTLQDTSKQEGSKIKINESWIGDLKRLYIIMKN
jgi:hypothetical protein